MIATKIKSKAGEKDKRGVYHDENGRFSEGMGGGNGKLEPIELSQKQNASNEKATNPRSTLGPISEIGKAVFDALKCSDPDFDDETNKKYQKALSDVLGAMPDAALQRVLKNTRGISYYKTPKEMTEKLMYDDDGTPNDLAQKYKEGEVIGGGFSNKDRRLHLDGNYKLYADFISDKRVGTHEPYAHELTHAMDIKELSTSGDWMDAYYLEISKGQLSHYASSKADRHERSNLSEGFAEFGRLLYGTDKDLAEIEQKFPTASQFWKDQGLWPESKLTEAKPETPKKEQKAFESAPVETKPEEIEPIENPKEEVNKPEAKKEPKKEDKRIPKESKKAVSKAKKQISSLSKRIKKSASSAVKKLAKKAGRGKSGQRGFNRLASKVHKQINDKALRAYGRLAKGKDRKTSRGILQVINDLARQSSHNTISDMERIWNRELRGTPLGKHFVRIDNRFWLIKSEEDAQGNLHASKGSEEGGQFVAKQGGEKGKGKLERKNKESDYLSSASDLEDEFKDYKARAKRAVSFGSKDAKKQSDTQRNAVREYGKERIQDLLREDQIVGTLKPIKNMPLGDTFTPIYVEKERGAKQVVEDPKTQDLMTFAGMDVAPGLGEYTGYFGIDKNGETHRFEYHKEHDKIRQVKTKEESRRDKKFGGMKAEEYRTLMDRASQQQNVKQPEYKFFVNINNRFWEVKYSPSQPRGKKGTDKGGQFIEVEGSSNGKGKLEEKDSDKTEIKPHNEEPSSENLDVYPPLVENSPVKSEGKIIGHVGNMAVYDMPYKGDIELQYKVNSAKDLESEIVHLEKLGDESNANGSFIATLKNGHKGVFKPASGESDFSEKAIEKAREYCQKNKLPFTDVYKLGQGFQYQREIAASKIAEILGLSDLVPITIQHGVDDEIGSIQAYSNDSKTGYKTSVEKGQDAAFDGDEDLARAAIFDYLIGSRDKHSKNWMLNKDGKLVLIDNGLSFPEDGWAINQKVFKGHALLMEKASEKNLPIPKDAAKWKDNKNKMERELRKIGLSPGAISSFSEKLDYVSDMASKGGTISDLKANDSTLGEQFKRYGTEVSGKNPGKKGTQIQPKLDEQLPKTE